MEWTEFYKTGSQYIMPDVISVLLLLLYDGGECRTVHYKSISLHSQISTLLSHQSKLWVVSFILFLTVGALLLRNIAEDLLRQSMYYHFPRSSHSVFCLFVVVFFLMWSFKKSATCDSWMTKMFLMGSYNIKCCQSGENLHELMWMLPEWMFLLQLSLCLSKAAGSSNLLSLLV